MARRRPLDEARCDALYRRYQPTVYRLLFRMTWDHQAAEDLTAETFLRVVRYGIPEDDDHARNLVFSVARNAARRHWARTAFGAIPAGRFERWFPGPPVADFAAVSAIKIDIRRALVRLRPSDRALLWAYYGQDADMREIAAQLDIEVNTAYKRLARARKRLKRMVRQNNVTTALPPIQVWRS